MLKVKLENWVEGASPLVDFKIVKFIGSLITDKQASVKLIYKNGKFINVYGDEKKVLDYVVDRIEKKKNLREKRKFMISFGDAWKKAEEHGYSEYKRLSGDENPVATADRYGFLDHASPAKLISQRLHEKGMDGKELAEIMQKLGKDERQKQSTTYTHLSGKNEVSRNVAIEYSKILDIDPVDLMFPKKTTKVWGKVNTKKSCLLYTSDAADE